MEPELEGMNVKNKNIRSSGRLSFLRGRAGMTMVNVIVAFVVLLILAAMFTQVVRLSENLIVKADSLREQTSSLLMKYYTNDGSLTQTRLGSDTSELTLSTDGGSSFRLNAPVYSYSDGAYTLYSFGEHELPTANGG